MTLVLEWRAVNPPLRLYWRGLDNETKIAAYQNGTTPLLAAVFTVASGSTQDAVDAAALAAAKADEATVAAASATAAASAVTKLAPAKLAGTTGFRLDMLINTGVNTIPTPAVTGTVNSLSTFARGSIAYELSGNSYLTIASGVAADTTKGRAFRPALNQLVKQPQNCKVSPWTATGIASRVDSGNSILGVPRQLVTLDTSTGQHRLTQSSIACVAGNPYTAIAYVEPASGITQYAINLSGAAFSSPPLVLFDAVALSMTVLSGTVERYNFIPYGSGYLFWITRTASTTTNGSTTLYAAKGGAVSFTGAGETFYFCSVNVVDVAHPVPPIFGTTANTSRAADVMSLALNGTSHSAMALVISDNMAAPSGRFLDLNNTATNRSLAIIENGGAFQLRSDNAGAVQTVAIGNRTGDDAISISYDEVSGVVAGALNGKGFGPVTLTSPPTGLNKLNIGGDGSGARQCNAFVPYVETGVTALSPASITAATKEKAPATVRDVRRVFFVSDGVAGFDGAYVLTSMPNGTGGEDYVRWQSKHASNPSDNCTGLKSEANYHVLRTGDLSFATSGIQLSDTDPADDDSGFEVGSPLDGNFWAIVANTVTDHGQANQLRYQWYVDGRPTTPPTSMIFAENCVELHQVVRFTSFIDGRAVMDRTLVHRWSSEGKRVFWGGDVLSNFTLQAGSYPFMLSANIPLYDALSIPGTTVAQAAMTTGRLANTAPYPIISATGGGYAATLQCLRSTINGVGSKAQVFGQMAATSARKKLYCQMSTTDLALVAGNRLEAEGLYRFSKL